MNLLDAVLDRWRFSSKFDIKFLVIALLCLLWRRIHSVLTKDALFLFCLILSFFLSYFIAKIETLTQCTDYRVV